MKKQESKYKSKLDLINSEGAIIVAKKTYKNSYDIFDQWGCFLDSWSQENIEDFLYKRLSITDTRNRTWIYPELSEGMQARPELIEQFLKS
jgi:hypothetical protein